ncbi:alpha/beta hydrolase [Metasolibacillus sp. FSL H7-0170]|uniref:alpha/beta hydrolase n=1 Tax=Metasolibacillus TaxID=2703677 RepID=UPI000793D32C|nr:alpha/beta hydrolase [Metasolibacillus fluoroglycofenilyticus]KYG91422.1 lysophospholipase [[Bacillus] sp. KCTC 13219]
MWKWEADGQPKAVVAIVHSAYEHHRWYAWLIEKLRSAGFHVVMGDLPGHGEQAQNRGYHDEDFFKYEDYVKQLVEIGLSENLPVFVIGNGLGATVLMNVLQKKKLECAGAIFVSPWLQLKLQPGKMSNALTSISALTSSVKLQHDITMQRMSRNYEVYEELKDDVPHNTTVTVKWYKDLQQLLKRLKNVEVKFPNLPILMMTGERDSITDIQVSKNWLLQQPLTHFQYKEWSDCQHSLYFEMEREEVYLYTKDFMNNVLRSLGYII